MNIIVTGAGGFIGGHLVKRLLAQGHAIRAADIKPLGEWWQRFDGAHNFVIDLRDFYAAQRIFDGWRCDRFYHLAAYMGGMGTISQDQLAIIRDNTMINANTIELARRYGVGRFFFSSSACAYPVTIQGGDAKPLKEDDVYPAYPQHSYGWEKLHMEHLCMYFKAELDTRVARFHNCYGPFGAFEGGREKAPAALIRKTIQAIRDGSNEIEIWGDGTAVRSYMYVDDCVDGIIRLMESDWKLPMNIGHDLALSVDELVDIIEKIGGIELKRRYVEGPVGVQWRNSDNSLCKDVLNWEPTVPPEEGLAITYQWIERVYR